MKLNNIELKWLGHSAFVIKTEENIIYIDPYKISGGEKANIILITHPHYDHCSLQDINKIVEDKTIAIVPADCQSKIARLDNVDMRIIDVGQTIDFGEIKIGAVPAYNINKEFHPKGERWLGYVLKVGKVIIYHAGDTDLIPEMEKLRGKVNVALLPVSGTYTMNAEEAAEAAEVINPSLAVPIHWGAGVAGERRDAENFVKLCGERGIKAAILEKE